MEQLYGVNGLVFWTEQEIATRRAVESLLVQAVQASLKRMNSAWESFQVEAPILTPRSFVNANYGEADMFITEGMADAPLIARPETTMGSYEYARHLLNPHNERKVRMPLVVWQHGKSFRREQDQPTKFMRLKEFYQLEFQCIYGLSTAIDYASRLVPDVAHALSLFVGGVSVEPSDRVPAYAEWTKDVMRLENRMELCSISQRRDFEGARVLEVAVGTDRVVSNFLGR